MGVQSKREDMDKLKQEEKDHDQEPTDKITIKKETSDMWGFKDVIFGEVRSKREDLDEMQQEEMDCEQESPCMVVLGGMKEEIFMDDDRPLQQPTADPLQLSHILQPADPISAVSLQRSADPLQLSHPLQPTDPLNQQDRVESRFAKTTNPEANKENAIECKDCGKMYANEAKLKQHVNNIHKRAKNIKCDWPNCAKTFFGNNQLERHKLSHTGAKPHKCTEPGCGKSFTEMRNLNFHKLSHSGEKPYKCSEVNCGKAFKDPSGLWYHKLTHSGEKTFKCSEANCGKAYKAPSGLRRHKKTQHREKLDEEVEVEEEGLVQEEIVAKELVKEKILVKELVKEEMMDMEDRAQCKDMKEESDPLKLEEGAF